MGSEHYCLRWNNHQSNLLGVFSQLLQDESLVDVTLACSEGAPIRAHKVVLSACSSYFQSLFLDHPERHPIVILKDVRFAELQTLVEFMYKGEVNVQYCQLSALLKTAESLKVKGLAEMTNQNTTLREPEREPDRLRPHSSQPGKTSCDSPVDAALAGPSSSSSSSSSSAAAPSAAAAVAAAAAAAAAAAVAPSSSSGATHSSAAASAATTSAAGTSTAASERNLATSASASQTLKREASDRCSPSPPKRLLPVSSKIAVSPVPLDLYHHRRSDANDASDALRVHTADATPSTSSKPSNRCGTPPGAADLSAATTTSHHDNNVDERDFRSPPDHLERPPSIGLHRASDDAEEIEDVDDDYDEEMMMDDDDDDDDGDNSSNEIGLNLKNIAAMVAANTAAASHASSSAAAALAAPHSPPGGGGVAGGDAESARSTPAGAAAAAATTSSATPSDLTQRPSSRSSRDGGGGGGGGGGAHCSSDRPSSSGAYALPSTSTRTGGDLSPKCAAASAAAGVGEPLAGTSGLGPVQSVPLSLKKEIDCSEDDNSSSRHILLQPRSASAGGGLGGGGVGELDYRASHESLFRNFGHTFAAGMGVAGAASSIAAVAARCPTPFAFPFTPLGLSLFDVDPSRILSMLHHQTWLAEEAMRTRGLLPLHKEFPLRFAALSDLLAKEYQTPHPGFHFPAAADVPSTATAATPPQQQATHRSGSQPQLYKQQPPQPFNVRYPSPAAAPGTAFFPPHLEQQQHHHHHQQQQQQQQHLQQQQPHHQMKAKQARQDTESPLQTATSTQPSWSPKDAAFLQELQRKSDNSAAQRHNEEAESSAAAHEPPSTPDESGSAVREGNTSGSGSGSGSSSNTPTSSSLYKNSLEQLLQRRYSSSSLGDGLRCASSYSQLLLSASCSTSTSTSAETASLREKSSSSSTSSTPPLGAAAAMVPPASTTTAAAALLAQHHHQQHQQLGHALKSPSAECALAPAPAITPAITLFADPIEEETRCVVCNAHFPNVWLLEQHAALQHPHLGPGEEKPFICEQCGQSYRYRSAYAKHKEQNHRARLPADKLFTCDVCGMQFRYLKSFKKHRLNHALERLHGKKIAPAIVAGVRLQMAAGGGGSGGSGGGGGGDPLHAEQDVVTSSQEPNAPADEGGEDLRINIKREPLDEDERRVEEQDNTIDSAGGGVGGGGGLLLFSDNNSTASTSTEPNITSSDGINSTNKRPPRLLTTPHPEADPPYHRRLQQHQPPQHHLAPTQLAHVVHPAAAHHQPPSGATAAAAAAALSSLHSINSITSLINAERIPSEQFLGLNPQEASILNFLRVDAAERQRDKRNPQTSRFACPFCGKCVRSKENLKLHVRKHTGERPFVCLFCGRAFGGKSDLTRHLRIHTGERPYHCESCGKCFARADYLSKHLTTHIHNAPR